MTGVGGILFLIVVTLVVRYVIRGLVSGAFRKPVDSGRRKPDLSTTWSAVERARNTALLQNELDRRGDGRIRVSCIALESERTAVIPPRFLMVTADLAEDKLSFDRKAEIARSIVTICMENSLVADVGGVELMLRNALGGGSYENTRLSILNSSLDLAARIEGAHIAQPEPFSGIRTRVYRTTDRSVGAENG
jgi:hypothetical protein